MLVNLLEGHLSLNLCECRSYGDRYSGTVQYSFTLNHCSDSQLSQYMITESKVGSYLIKLFPLEIKQPVILQSIKCTRKKENFPVVLKDNFICFSRTVSHLESFQLMSPSGDHFEAFKILIDFESRLPSLQEKLVGMFCLCYAQSVKESFEQFEKKIGKNKKLTAQLGSKTKIEETAIISTLFEPCYASLCFPCWNDSSIRVSWKIAFYLEKGRSVISNMHQSQQNSQHEFHHRNSRATWITFDKTPILPPYLLSWSVADNFEEHEHEAHSSESSPYHVKVFTPIGLPIPTHIPDSVLQWACQTVALCYKYFDTSLEPLESLQFILLPNFLIGGMEGHGMITLNVKSYLFGAQSRNKDQALLKEFYALIVHEVIHQWIGNLSGMCFLLKEGITQYLEMIFFDFISETKSFPNRKNRAIASISDRKRCIALARARLKKASEAINKDNCFNGSFYQSSLQEIVNLADLVGHDKLQENLRALLRTSRFKYVEFEGVFDALFT